MKTRFSVLLALCITIVTLPAQRAGKPADATDQITVKERGPHHRVIERTVVETLPDGTTRERKSSYTELATGLHYRGENDEWQESREEIEILDGAAVARQGPNKVIFAANINSAGAIDFEDALGQRYRSHVLGLVYTDYASGKSVMIAEVKDSIGEVVTANQVLYADAFDGDCAADIRYTYTKAGFEQDIILRTAPPSPAEWGLSPETTRLEVFTEFIESPPGTVTAQVIKQGTNPAARALMKEPDLIDQKLDFGGMIFGPGQAFPLGSQNDAFSEDTVPTGKSMEQIDGRHILIEKVDYPSVERQLRRLPKSASLDRNRKVGLPEPGRTLLARALPARPRGEAGKWTRRLQASVDHPVRPGFVLDYVSVSAGSLTNYQFYGDMTYHITGVVDLYGTTIIEGGTVIKYSVAGNLNIQAGLDCRTGPYRPATFTAREDNTIGETISGSSGTPTNGAYASPNGMLRFLATTITNDVHDIRAFYPHVALVLNASVKANVSNVQIGKGNYALSQQNASVVTCRNFLFYDLSLAGTLVSSSPTNFSEHGTVHRVSDYRSGVGGSFALTNSLLISVTNNLVFNGQNNVTNLNDIGFFRSVGAGGYYLASGSTNRNAGTTNINPILRGAFRKKTTVAPVVIGDGGLFTNNLTLYPQAQRDTDVPDLGYHYDPLDYVFGGLLVTNGTITAMPGVAIGTHSANGVGLGLLSGSAFYCEGTADSMNRFVRYNMVQEQSNTNWTAVVGGTPWGIATAWSTAPVAPVMRLRFTEFSLPAAASLNSFHLYSFGEDGGMHTIRDCQFHNADIWSERSTLNITNSLFNRTRLYVAQVSYTMNLAIKNSSFVGGLLELYNDNTGSWVLKDNLFDATTNYVEGTVTHSYNAYTTNATRFLPTNVNDVKLSVTNITYQTGWLGNFYVPTNITSHSPLFNAGSQNATNAGLYHYTMVTNQTRELSTTVDIGFHYVAVGTNGLPLNTDGDSAPSYLEDTNGNGSLDAGETDFNVYNSTSASGSGPGLISFTPFK